MSWQSHNSGSGATVTDLFTFSVKYSPAQQNVSSHKENDVPLMMNLRLSSSAEPCNENCTDTTWF
jgi:hypothetical protein